MLLFKGLEERYNFEDDSVIVLVQDKHLFIGLKFSIPYLSDGLRNTVFAADFHDVNGNSK